MRRERYHSKPGHWPISLIWLLLLVSILAFTGTALGQGRDDVRAQLERTDELLENAQELISEAGSVSGNSMLAQAARNQKNAWDTYGRGHWGQALQMTLRAREDIYRALGNIRQNENNDTEVEKQLERTDLVLEEAGDLLPPGSALGPRRKLEMATAMQRRAWELFREHNLRPSLRLTLQARQMVLRLANDAGPGQHGAPIDDATFKTRYDRLTEGLERIEDRLAGTNDANANAHVERARQALDLARQAFDNGDSGRANHALNDARRELERAMRLVIADARADDIATLIESAEERLDLIAPSVDESGDQQLHDWFDQAKEGLVQARSALTEGRNQRALYQTRRVVDLLNRISDEAGL
jgi:hypothetical protein